MHQICRITDFQILAPYRIRIQFDDGHESEIDLGPILHGPIYGPLRDETLFRGVKIDEEIHTLVWPNGADFDPETLYNWPNYANAWKAKAQEWAMTAPAVGSHS